MSIQEMNAGQRRDLTLALVAFGIAFVLWQIQGLFFITYPFRLFVTMIHELGHGLSAMLTGGEFVKFEVSKRGAGLATTRPGVRFVIIQAGYLGTAIFGAVLLFLANRTKRPSAVAIGVGTFLIILTVLFSGIELARLGLLETLIVGAISAMALYMILVSETNQGRYVGLAMAGIGGVLLVTFAGGGNVTLTVSVGVISGALLILLGYYGSRNMTVITLDFLAFLTGLQAITDAWVLLQIISLSKSIMPANDASTMASEIGGPAALWAVLWIALDIIIFGAAVYLTFIRPIQTEKSAEQAAA